MLSYAHVNISMVYAPLAALGIGCALGLVALLVEFVKRPRDQADSGDTSFSVVLAGAARLSTEQRHALEAFFASVNGSLDMCASIE